MSFSNKDLSGLEQLCERIAVMAYEVFTGEMAYRLKSIDYKYVQQRHGHIKFTARFDPTEESGRHFVMVQFVAIPTQSLGHRWSIEQMEIGYEHQYHRMCRVGFAAGPTVIINSTNGATVFSGDGCGTREVADFSVSPKIEDMYLLV